MAVALFCLYIQNTELALTNCSNLFASVHAGFVRIRGGRGLDSILMVDERKTNAATRRTQRYALSVTR
jgi:hypothetical protein